MKLVFVGLSLSSSWGNGHATTYRGLLRELARRGHEITFLERDTPWYSTHRDLSGCEYAALHFYTSLEELRDVHARQISEAEAVVIGSYVPEGAVVSEWILETASGLKVFYDIDTPVTLGKLSRGETDYLSSRLVPQFDLYLSFTGGPTLTYLELRWGASCARPLYCSVDPDVHYPEPHQKRWSMGYLGTYSDDRHQGFKELMLEVADLCRHETFAVAGSQYPDHIQWPRNIERIEHLPPPQHREFYSSQRFTLNLTRREMKAAGYSPSVRLFEAAACGVPIISDPWTGLDNFFRPGSEILVVEDRHDVVKCLRDLTAEQALEIGGSAHKRVLRHHTAAHRAAELETYLLELSAGRIPAPLFN